ncbi:terpene synthase family protein [Micromonospora sp. CA-248260]|uniref:terpene synthase family protein n=1 Tax=Micromonospora sp. CA-248260 TaxID=3239962 RepID=UPI003D8C4F91
MAVDSTAPTATGNDLCRFPRRTLRQRHRWGGRLGKPCEASTSRRCSNHPSSADGTPPPTRWRRRAWSGPTGRAWSGRVVRRAGCTGPGPPSWPAAPARRRRWRTCGCSPTCSPGCSWWTTSATTTGWAARRPPSRRPSPRCWTSSTGTGPRPAGALGAALADLCRRVGHQRRPALLLRLVSQLRAYLLALLWEAANREHRRVPGVAEYRQMRRHTGGVRPSLALTDLAYGRLPGARRRVDPAVVALDDLAVDLVCWCNDLFSYRKEQGPVADPHNLVTVLAAQTGRGEAAAFRLAAGWFNDGLADYLVREAALVAHGGPALTPYLAARRSWLRATYDWSARADRYA